MMAGKRVGLAGRAMRRFRERKVEMKMILDDDVIGWLNWMIRAPDQMPIRLLGGLVAQNFAHYKAPDMAAAKQMMALKLWMEKKLLISKGRNDRNQPIFDIGPDPVETSLKASYVERLRELQKHYRDVGMLQICVGAYVKLDAALEGKSFDPEEVEEVDIPETTEEPAEKGEAA